MFILNSRIGWCFYKIVDDVMYEIIKCQYLRNSFFALVYFNFLCDQAENTRCKPILRMFPRGCEEVSDVTYGRTEGGKRF